MGSGGCGGGCVVAASHLCEVILCVEVRGWRDGGECCAW